MSLEFNDMDYYSQYIFGLIIIYTLLILVFKLLDNKNKRELNRSISFDYYGIKDNVQILHDDLTPDQINLRMKFLIAVTIIKSGFWVKAPYYYALYSRLHGFTREEIAYLLLVENISSIISGPLIGSLSDSYGKKKFSAAYCFLIIINICLRLTGEKSLAWIAQIIAGFGSILIEISFESWLNFQASTLFDDNKEGKRQKNSFLREVFTKQIYIDSLTAIFFTGVATLLYDSYGISAPFYLCIALFLISGLYIVIVWEENNINFHKKKKKSSNRNDIKEDDNESKSFFQKIAYSWTILKNDKPLFLIGVIESTYKISTGLWIYIWTPLLEETTSKIVNVGVIYACFMFAKLIGCEFYQGLKKILKSNTFLITLFLTITGAISFYLEYHFNKFNIRLISLIYFDGTLGAFQPLMSSLKSLMIPEGQRSTIMTFFRLPINIVNVFTLFFSTYLTISQICLIGFGLLIISSITTIALNKYHSPPDAESRLIFTTTEIKNDHELEDKYFKDSIIEDENMSKKRSIS